MGGSRCGQFQCRRRTFRNSSYCWLHMIVRSNWKERRIRQKELNAIAERLFLSHPTVELCWCLVFPKPKKNGVLDIAYREKVSLTQTISYAQIDGIFSRDLPDLEDEIKRLLERLSRPTRYTYQSTPTSSYDVRGSAIGNSMKCSSCGGSYQKWQLDWDGKCNGCNTGWDDDAG